MDSLYNTLNCFKILNFATIRGAAAFGPPAGGGARDSLLVARCPLPPTKIRSNPLKDTVYELSARSFYIEYSMIAIGPVTSSKTLELDISKFHQSCRMMSISPRMRNVQKIPLFTYERGQLCG